MESIGTRIKKIREEYLHVNQRVFSKEIGISQPALAMFEKGDREPKEVHIKNICMKNWNGKTINEEWLRTGKGGDDNMFKSFSDEDEYMIAATEIGLDANERIRNAIIKYAKLSLENKKLIDDALDLAIELFKE